MRFRPVEQTASAHWGEVGKVAHAWRVEWNVQGVGLLIAGGPTRGEALRSVLEMARSIRSSK